MVREEHPLDLVFPQIRLPYSGRQQMAEGIR